MCRRLRQGCGDHQHISGFEQRIELIGGADSGRRLSRVAAPIDRVNGHANGSH